MQLNQTLPIHEVIIEDRQRKDLGNINALSQSIKDNGLIQPIVVNQSKRLVAGGRRLAACTILGWETIPVVYIETLSERQLTILELEENVRRKEMSWTEETLAVAKIHKLRSQDAALESNAWTQQMTGELLGVSTAQIGFLLRVAKELKDATSGIYACSGFTDALRWIMRREEDKGSAEIAKRIKEQFKPIRPISIITAPLIFPSDSLISIEPVPLHETETIPLSQMCIHGDCLKWLTLREEESVDHIITDPPYGIDLEMLNQQNPHGGLQSVERVEETHKVDENLSLLEEFIPRAYRVLRSRGFLIMWCDVMNWQFIYDLCHRTGFKIQRWPNIWHKTSACMNQSAQYNFTKNYESAIVCRKEAGTLVSPNSSSIYSCGRTGYTSNPFAKPLDLWTWLIKAVSIQGQTILDPFAGEGSCPKTCNSLGRLPIGIEKEEYHYNVMLDSMKSLCDVIFRKPIYT